MIAGKFQNLDLNQIGNIVASKNLRHPFQKVWLKVWKACKSAMTIHNLNQLLQSLSITHEGKLFLSYVKHTSIYEILKVWQEKILKCEFMNSTSTSRRNILSQSNATYFSKNQLYQTWWKKWTREKSSPILKSSEGVGRSFNFNLKHETSILRK